MPILADPRAWDLHGSAVAAALEPLRPEVLFLAGEGEKRFAAVERLTTELAERRVHRREVLVIFGGGVCCDVGGLVAMLYMRGMRYVIVATTLMAQIDAAIGGKVGCNTPGRKNLLGGFHHPELVLIDPGFLGTLPERHLRAALAEALKMHVLLPALAIKPLLEPAGNRDQFALEQLAERCLDGKLALLEKDPFEADLRRSLNLGHAVAHALEAEPGSTLLHGEAVAIGLAATARYAEMSGISTPGRAESIIDQLKRLRLPDRTEQETEGLASRLEAIADHRGGEIHLVVPAGDEGVEIVEDCDFGLLARCASGVPVAL
ncbi:MAG TPA: 3-dehydroquinate synthase family protein [Solirubrobacterales bacterium]|nr:3-dehydroquinate synthase family protein [Solirubrobacterales bacterium]